MLRGICSPLRRSGGLKQYAKTKTKQPNVPFFNIQNEILRIKRDSISAIKIEGRKNSEITTAAA